MEKNDLTFIFERESMPPGKRQKLEDSSASTSSVHQHDASSVHASSVHASSINQHEGEKKQYNTSYS
jgi:hypothetical protein